MKVESARIYPVIGYRSSGVRRIFLTPELTLIILVAMMEHDKWEDRIKAIEEARPDLAGHFKRKNMIMKAQRYGWSKVIKELKQQMNDAAKDSIKVEKEDALKRVLQSNMELLKDLEEQRDRIKEFLKTAELGTKTYTGARSDLLAINKEIEKLAGVERVRKQDDLQDKVHAALFLSSQKAAQESDQSKLGSGHSGDEPVFVEEEGPENPFLLD